MDNVKIAKYIQNIFHLENMTADDDSYNKGTLHSDSWGNGITIRWIIRDFGGENEVILRYAYSLGSYSTIIESGMTSKQASKEIVELIGRVLITQADTVDPNTGMNNILSWPYNCNLAYVEYLIEALQYGDNEIKSSRKPIKSDYHLEPGEMKAYQITNYDVHYGRKDDYFLYNIKGEYSPDKPDELINLIKNQLKYHKKIYRLEFGTGEIFDVEYDENMEPRLIPANKITSSMQGQERGIQAIMDEYGCSREEAIDIMNSEVTSGCHGKAKKKNKKEIKSSLVDEFEDSYCNASNEWPEEERHSYEDSFINGFAKDHGITYDETKKMLDELEDKWYKDAVNAGIVDIYSSTRRNIANLNRIFK